MAITLNGTTGISSPGGDTSTSLATTNLSYTGTLTGGTGVIAIGATQIYKDASGNVGIGTSSPAQLLHVAGRIAVSGSGYTVSSTNGLIGAYTGNMYVQMPSGGSLQIWKSTTDAVATFDQSGNLGLGVTPSAWSNSGNIQIGGGGQNIVCTASLGLGVNWYYNVGYKYYGTGLATNYIQETGVHKWYTAGSGTAGDPITFGNPKMTLTASGDLGIGASPSYRLDVSSVGSAATETGLRIINPYASGVAVAATNILFGYHSGAAYRNSAKIEAGQERSGTFAYGYLAFSTQSSDSELTERARIDSSGNLLVGCTSINPLGSTRLVLSENSGTTKWAVGPIDIAVNNFYVYAATGAGVFLSGTSATSWSSNSDERLKTDLKPIENAAQKVSTLRAVTGRYKTDAEGFSRAFLIAQDVQKVLPEAVGYTKLVGADDETDYLALAYTDTIPLLVAAIKELTTRLEALEAQ